MSVCSTTSAISRCAKNVNPPGNQEGLSPLLETLLQHSKSVGLSGMEEYYTQYAEAEELFAVPQHLATSLYDKGIDTYELSVILPHCEKHTHAASVTDTQAAAVEMCTRQQH